MTSTFSRLSAELADGARAAAVDAPAESTAPFIVGALIAMVAVAAVAYQLGRRRTLAPSTASAGAAERLQMLERVLQHTPNQVSVTDLSGRYLLANEPFRRLSGAAAEVEGSVEPLHDPGLAKLRAESDAAALDGPYEFDSWLDTPEGRRFFQNVKFPLHDADGEVYAIASIARDITRQELAVLAVGEARDAAVYANYAKTTFLATMSHEIRTPLNAVVGMTDLLLDTDLDATQQEFVETVRSSGDALLAVINNILDFSKIEFGDLQLDSAPFDLRDQIEGSLDTVGADAAAKGVDLLCYVDESCPSWVTGDAGRLRQILTNLLANAVKFTDAGEVVLEVSGEDAGDGRTRLKVSVADTGIGMDPAALDRLFSPFFQADASSTRTYEGSGLGLVISQRLAAAMTGQLTATSTAGVGSTFTLTVVVDGCARPLATGVRNSVAHLTGRSVLVVDDNLANLRILNQQLSTWGMLCTTASTPSEALRVLGAGPSFDVALLDMRMPEMSGDALALAIRALPSGKKLPLVLLTSVSQPAESEKLFAARLTKPTKSAALRDVLATVISAAGAEEATTPAAESVAPQTGGRLHILLAEDNPVNQRVAQLMLAKLGHDVDTVSDGRQAVAAAAATPYDVIMMDIQMPDMDGKEATCEIRAAAGHQPRIVAMTASVLVEDREACAAAGMDDYLSKPVRVQALRAALAGVVAMSPSVGARAAGTNGTAGESSATDGSNVVGAGSAARVSAPSTVSGTAAESTEAVPPAIVPVATQLVTPDPAAEPTSVPVAPIETEPPAVDVSALDTLVQQLDPRETGLRDVLLTSYLDEGSAQMSRLLMAAANSDLPTVIAMSHTLRSTSALLGAAHLAALLQLTEDAARGDSGALIPLARKIDLEHARVVVELNGLRRPAVALR